MTTTILRSRASLESLPGAVVHTEVAEINDPLVGGAKYFVTFIDDASGHIRACHMMIKAEAVELLKQLVCWVK